MKGLLTAACVVLTTATSSLCAEEYSYLARPFGDPVGPLPTPDGVCAIVHQLIVARYTSDEWAVTPYRQPFPIPDKRPGADPAETSAFGCPYQLISLTTSQQPAPSYYPMFRSGDGCKDGRLHNPASGKCEAPDEEQLRKALGDAAERQSAGVIYCGNPVNVGAGNKFERDEDYADSDGELRFVRFYNGLVGTWRHSYSATLLVAKRGSVVTFDDGYSAVFKKTNDTLIPEPGELGSLVKVVPGWLYTSASNEKLAFDERGVLIGMVAANGAEQRVTHEPGSGGDVVIHVTDSRGHSLSIVENPYGILKTMSINDLTTSYAFDIHGQLESVTKLRGSQESTRKYLYEDKRNHSWLTGLVDERGIRYASWSYDEFGRAISSEHAGAADRVTMTYGDDQTSVTNALGHVTRYSYRVFQGVRRVVVVDGEPAAGCPASNSTFAYTQAGQLQTHKDALGHVTSYEYDDQGRETRRASVHGTTQERVTTFTWDGVSRRPATITTPGRVTTYQYDGKGRQINVTVSANKE